MADEDIEKIRKLLKRSGKNELANLVRYSTSAIDQSTTYGNYLFSVLSTFEIYSPLEEYEQLKKTNEDDRNAILDAALKVYPPKAYSPEIYRIEFYPDMNLEPKDRTIPCETLKEIGVDYIDEQITKCEEKISSEDYDGAITNARALVETVCLNVLDESGIVYKYDGDLPKLYKASYKELQLDPALYQDDCFKQILSGLISIVNGLSSVRNLMSDAHGKIGEKYYKPAKRHAVLAVNVAKVVSEFIYSSWKSKKP